MEANETNAEHFTYPAIFTYTSSRTFIEFPDFPGLSTFAGTNKQAREAAKEILGRHLWKMETRGQEFPEPSHVGQIALRPNQLAFPIKVQMPIARTEMKHRRFETKLACILLFSIILNLITGYLFYNSYMDTQLMAVERLNTAAGAIHEVENYIQGLNPSDVEQLPVEENPHLLRLNHWVVQLSRNISHAQNKLSRNTSSFFGKLTCTMYADIHNAFRLNNYEILKDVEENATVVRKELFRLRNQLELRQGLFSVELSGKDFDWLMDNIVKHLKQEGNWDPLWDVYVSR